MFELQQEQYERYLSDYKDFVGRNLGVVFEKEAELVIEDFNIARILQYSSTTQSKETFLVVPSLFNSPEILFLAQDSFIENLRDKGEVYLMDWRYIEEEIRLEDFVAEIGKIIAYLNNKKGQKLNLVGHCIGGNLALGAAKNIKTLTLLTTPWDYSHLKNMANLHSFLQLEKSLEGQKAVPSLYIEMMFFLMFPTQFKDKIDKYSLLGSNLSQEAFLQVERWLHSGKSIPKSVYQQIIKEFCQQNILMNLQWKIRDMIVDPAQIKVPTCIVLAKKDQIAPKSSIMPLHLLLKNSRMIELKGGHISYLVNGDDYFQKEYNAWLTENLTIGEGT